MRFIDFFAGIGGISLGLERAGHECVGHCEIDEYACKVLKKHWPDVPLFGDIKEIDANELPEAELWTGGFPCQDISNAGKREGIRGSRSGLFFAWMRLVRKVRPKYLLMENVAALLSRGLGDVLGELATSGYDASWILLPAGAIGAPHFRCRIFIIAFPRMVVPNGYMWHSRIEDWRELRWDGNQSDREAEWNIYRQGHQPGIPRVAHGVPCRVDRHRCLGNAVVPQVAEYIGRLLPL